MQSLSSGRGTERWFARVRWSAKAEHQKVRTVVPDCPESLSRVALVERWGRWERHLSTEGRDRAQIAMTGCKAAAKRSEH